jgi:hypothetical protein
VKFAKMSVQTEAENLLESSTNRDTNSYICCFSWIRSYIKSAILSGLARSHLPFLIKKYVPTEETTNSTNLLNLLLDQIDHSIRVSKTNFNNFD